MKHTNCHPIFSYWGGGIKTNHHTLFNSHYHLVMTNSSPWKITILSSSVNHLFLWAISHGYVSHNQRVDTKINAMIPMEFPMKFYRWILRKSPWKFVQLESPQQNGAPVRARVQVPKISGEKTMVYGRYRTHRTIVHGNYPLVN